jgi:hypothetical protein
VANHVFRCQSGKVHAINLALHFQGSA